MTFNFKIKKDPNAIIDRVCYLAKDRVIISGDTAQGQFSGLFDGTYQVQGEKASVKFTKKPLFISWSLVQQGLNYLTA